MLSKTLYYFSNDKQYPNLKDEKKMGKRQSYNIFLRDLIRDNCEHKNGYYSVDVHRLIDADKRIFLSYLIDLSDYEGISLEALMLEYGHEMQAAVDVNIGEIYMEDMEEMGLHLCRHKDNGEGFWIK